MTVRLRPEARSDVASIAKYIAKDNQSAAQGWSAEIRRLFEQLGEMPGLGVARFEVRPGLRTHPFGAYLVLYRKGAEGVEIVRVIHGARRWQDLL